MHPEKPELKQVGEVGEAPVAELPVKVADPPEMTTDADMMQILKQSFSEDCAEVIVRLLRKHDTNNDGMLDKQEAKNFLAALYIESNLASKLPDDMILEGEVSGIFRQHDLDGNEALDALELSAWLISSPYCEHLSEALKANDLRESGKANDDAVEKDPFILVDSLLHGLKEEKETDLRKVLRPNFSEEGIEVVLRLLWDNDTNHDGQLDRKEAKHFLAALYIESGLANKMPDDMILEGEVNGMFRKYDLDGNEVLDILEMSSWLIDSPYYEHLSDKYKTTQANPSETSENVDALLEDLTKA